MALSDVLARVLGFLRAGYPEGVPAGDYIPLVALLRRRLSDDDVVAVASELMAVGETPVQATDVRVAITKLTDEMPLGGRHRAGETATDCSGLAGQRLVGIRGIDACR